MRLVNRLYIGLLLTASAAFAQYPIPGSSGGGGGGGGCVAGTGITCVGSTISVDTAVIQSRAMAQGGKSTECVSATGSATMTCALTPTLTAYETNMCLVLNSNFANVTTATLDVDALGAKSVLNRSGAALAAGDIPLNKPVGICYDGTQWIVQGGSGSASVANAFATSVGAVTSLAIDITDLNVADLSQTLVQCWTGASAPFTEVAITSLNPASLTSITANFSSTANVTCRVNATGSAGAAGATGATGAAGPAPVYTTTTYSATPTFTVSASGIQGFFITLTGNVTSSTLSTGSATVGQDIWFNICENATGGYTFVPPANVIGMGTISTTANACSRQLFRWDGTNAIAVTSMTCPACSGSIYLPGSSSGGSTIQAPSTSGGTNTLPSGAGTLARTTDNVASATVLATPRAINTVNFDGSTPITIPAAPTGAGATATTNGYFAYDTTHNMLHAAQSGADAFIPQATITPANNDCIKWVVSGSQYKLGSAGAACGTSSAINRQMTLVVTDPSSTGTKSCSVVEVAGTIVAAHLISNALPTGANLVVDVLKVAYASYTGTGSASSITASAVPTITTAASNPRYEDTTLTGWTTSVSANDVVCVAINTAPSGGATWASLTLEVQ